MKKRATLLLLMLCVSAAPPSYAEKEKGASPQAYEHASEQAVFVRVSDWFATLGKSEEEKNSILAQRKAERAAKRAEQEAAKGLKQAEKEMEKAQKEGEKAAEGLTTLGQ